MRSPNLTPHPTTGIGRYTDGEIARAIRHGVRPDGRAMSPFMEFQNLSDEDLTALISFLRAAPAVEHAVKPSEPNVIGRAVLAFAIEPTGLRGPPRKKSPPADRAR